MKNSGTNVSVSPKFKSVSRETLSDAIAQQIVGLIARNALKPGDRLPAERALCTELGVGRTSVREAIKSLVATGVLIREGTAGTFVADESRVLENKLNWGVKLTGQEIEHIIETRAMLEMNSARWAALRAGEDDLKALTELHEQMQLSLDDAERFHDLDVEFHLVIARATQNDILIGMVQAMRSHLSAWIAQRLSVRKGEQIRRARISNDGHMKILDRLTDRDDDAAAREMERHLGIASNDLRERLRL